MGIISVEQANRLFWLGRYTERVHAMAHLYFESFDTMIDEEADSYPEFCRKIDIPNIYTDKEDFMYRYPYDITNPDSIISNLHRAYDNAIVLRESIGSETLSYIQLAIYDMNKASLNPAPLMEMQKIIDHINAFWGVADDSIDDEEIRNLLKAGKRIERVDLYARMEKPVEIIRREIHRMIPRVRRSGLTFDSFRMEHLEDLLQETPIDYYRIVRDVEAILKV